jgi:DNA-binding NarL/FixJ family response regulator
MAAAAAATFPPAAFPVFRTAPRQIRIVPGDAQLVLEGFSAMINREEDLTVVAKASTGRQTLDCNRWYRPDVVTLDLVLPDLRGDDLARRNLPQFPRTRIIAITEARTPAQARRPLYAGVHGYLSKAATGPELVGAMRQVRAGATTISGLEPVKLSVHPDTESRLGEN